MPNLTTKLYFILQVAINESCIKEKYYSFKKEIESNTANDLSKKLYPIQPITFK